MSFAYGVPCEEAVERAVERTIEVLDKKFATVADAVFNRGTGDRCDDDIYLPDPDTYYHQADPTNHESLAVPPVGCFVGQSGDEDFADAPEGTVDISGEPGPADEGKFWEVDLPIGVTIVFADAPEDRPGSEVLSKDLEPEAVLAERARKYLGALKYTLGAYCNPQGDSPTAREASIRSMTPSTSFTQAGLLHIGADETSPTLGGVAEFEFLANQYQIFPNLQTF